MTLRKLKREIRAVAQTKFRPEVDGILYTKIVNNIVANLELKSIEQSKAIQKGGAIAFKYLEAESINLIYNKHKTYYTHSSDDIHLRITKNQGLHLYLIFHEAIHSTGQTFRLNRHSFLNSAEYPFYNKQACIEELVALFGSFLLLKRCDIKDPRLYGYTLNYGQNYFWGQGFTDIKLDVCIKSAREAVNYILEV